MFRKKEKNKQSDNIIEFNLLEELLNKKLSEVINKDVIGLIDSEIERLDKETDEELEKLRQIIKPTVVSDKYKEQNPHLKAVWEIEKEINSQLELYQTFASKVNAMNYLKEIRDKIYTTLTNKRIDIKGVEKKW